MTINTALANKLVFTKTAAGRIFGVKPTQVKKVERWASVAFVVIKGIGARFVSLKTFWNDYRNSRRARAEQLEVIQVNDTTVWKVGDNLQTVFLAGKAMVCSCEDFAAMKDAGLHNHAGCKHQHAVARELGYDLSKLSELVKAGADLAGMAMLTAAKTAPQTTAKPIMANYYAIMPDTCNGISIV